MRKQDYYEPDFDDVPRRSKNTKKQKKKKSGSRGERAVVTLLSLLFLTVAVVATVKYVVRAPEPVTDGEDQQTQQDSTAEDSDAIQTISNGRERKSKYCYNILLYGVDNDAGGSDTNMLMRFDAENKTVDIVSLPRDTLMSNGHKLNSSYNNGGTEKLRSNIEDMLGVPVDFYVSVDLKGFIALIDQIGGVEFDVPCDMDYDDPYQDLHIHFKAGLQKLNGQQAMEVVRFRHNNDNTGYGGRQDLGRIGTQQAFLKTVAQKLMKLENVPAMAETFLKYVKTDLTLGNLMWLANQALSMGGMDAISFATLPGDGAGWYKGMSVYALDPEQVLEMTNSMLNPYATDITADDQNILVP